MELKKHLLLICYSFILSILSQNISAQNPTWMEVAPGVWKTRRNNIKDRKRKTRQSGKSDVEVYEYRIDGAIV